MWQLQCVKNGAFKTFSVKWVQILTDLSEICEKPACREPRAIIFTGVLLSPVIKSRNQYFFADMNELTLVLRSNGLPEYMNFQACRSSKTDSCEYTEPVVMGVN